MRTADDRFMAIHFVRTECLLSSIKRTLRKTPRNVRSCPKPDMALAASLAAVWACRVAERQRSREVCFKRIHRGRSSRISAMEPQHRALRVLGDKRARDVKATAQTKNRCCVFGDLSYRHCNRRNRYIDSSKTRTNTTVTVARGAPALAPAARAKHGLIEVKELS